MSDTLTPEALRALLLADHQQMTTELHNVGSFADADDVDVRLQAFGTGEWHLHFGDAQYDTDHRGFWGSASISRACPMEEARATVNELIEEAIDDYAQSL